MHHLRPGNKYQLFNKHARKFPTSFHKSLTLTAISNHLRPFFDKSRITKKKKNVEIFFWKYEKLKSANAEANLRYHLANLRTVPS